MWPATAATEATLMVRIIEALGRDPLDASGETLHGSHDGIVAQRRDGSKQDP
jgi:hypothetical protein